MWSLVCLQYIAGHTGMWSSSSSEGGVLQQVGLQIMMRHIDIQVGWRSAARGLRVTLWCWMVGLRPAAARRVPCSRCVSAVMGTAHHAF